MSVKFINKRNEVLGLRDSMNVLGGLVFGFIFFAVAAVLLFLGHFNPVLDCHNVAGKFNCVLTRQGIFPPRLNHIPLNNLQSAEVATHEDSDGDTYSVLLVDASGNKIPFTNYSSSGYGGKAAFVSSIKELIGKEKDFTIEYRQRGFWYAGIIIMSFALLILWGSFKSAFKKRMILEADLPAGQLRIYPYFADVKYMDARPIGDVQDVFFSTNPINILEHAQYMQNICQSRNLSLPLAVKIQLKASALLAAKTSASPACACSGNCDARTSVLVVKFKDGTYAYAQAISQSGQSKAVEEFKRYLGISE